MLTPVVLAFGNRAVSPDVLDGWGTLCRDTASWFKANTGRAPRLYAPVSVITAETPEGPSAHPPTHTQAMRIAHNALGPGTYSVLGIGVTSGSGAGDSLGCLIGEYVYRTWAQGYAPRAHLWMMLHEWGHVAGLQHPHDQTRNDTIMSYGSAYRFEQGAEVGFTADELAIIAGNSLWESTVLIMPHPGEITARFGDIDDAHPTPHTGVDIAGETWDRVNAAAAGTVEYISFWGQPGWAETFGTSVILRHDDCYTLYAHLAGVPTVVVGRSVMAGDQIGYIGSTGQSTAPHLHWGCAALSNPWFEKRNNLAELIDPLSKVGDDMPLDLTVLGLNVETIYKGFDPATNQYVYEIRVTKP